MKLVHSLFFTMVNCSVEQTVTPLYWVKAAYWVYTLGPCYP